MKDDELELKVSQAAEISEGKARLLKPGDGEPVVFYNPRMSLNRDVAVLFAQSNFPVWRRLRVCDPMTASAVRAVRYSVECPNVDSVSAVDADVDATEFALSTVRLNKIDGRISVIQADANVFLSSRLTDRFDLVDLDPYGSPAPFFEGALRATVDDGVLAATATDMAPLTGARSAACRRKYGITPVRTEFEKEIAVRILASNLASEGGKLELGVNVAFCHASDHYARIYATVRKGRRAANESLRFLGFLEYCPKCLNRKSRGSLEQLRMVCGHCGSRLRFGGPFWLGPLWDQVTVHRMIENCSTLESSRLSEVQNLLVRISEEATAPPFYHRTNTLSAALGIKPPKLTNLLADLRENGYCAVRTHFHPNGFRTDASIRELALSMASVARVT